MSNKRDILGQSPVVKKMIDLIHKVAVTRTNVLIIGESGTGKELVARMIHDSSPLKGRPFVPVNCGAIPETLIESEMFGHKKGSFTGAVNDKQGLFEVAHTGTLFLDEVGELPLSMQVKLLRAIQERSFRRIGANDDTKVEIRIIAATNRNLEQAVAKGTFREDLYYRLNVILIRTPPLRERGEDVRMLANVFLKKFAARTAVPITEFDADAMAAIEAWTWPGNVRELENLLERAVTLEPGTKISLSSLPHSMIENYQSKLARGLLGRTNTSGTPSAGGSAGGGDHASSGATGSAGDAAGGASGGSMGDFTGPSTCRSTTSGPNMVVGTITLPAPDFSKGQINLDQILGDVERVYLNAALQQSGGVRKRAAEMLGITFRSIRYRLKKLGVDGETPDDSSEGGDGTGDPSADSGGPDGDGNS